MCIALTMIRWFKSIHSTRLIKNHLPLLRKLRNLLINPPNLITQLLNRASRHRSSMGRLLGFLAELLFSALVVVALVLRFLGCWSTFQAQATRRACDFVCFALGEDVIEAGAAGLH